ncbi:MAG: DUF6516 family protein [Nitrososphaerales archaeon]
MARARLVLHEKQVGEDGSIIEAKIWSVPSSSLYPDGVKYSLVYIQGGSRMLGYDNAHGSHHRHYLRESQPYRFINIQALFRDFRRNLKRIRREEQK